MLTSPAYSETLVPVQPVTLEDRPPCRCWWIACFSTDGLALQRVTPASQRCSLQEAFDEVVTASPVAAWLWMFCYEEFCLVISSRGFA